ncbi:restriction endonuclease subunit S [Flavobacteriaceae bacterium 144Ye]|nr:restriction endonuclease subunit S [Flavobacteriaceae bacterium 144Ye]
MLGDYIQPVNIRNKSIITEDLRGLSMSKEFRKSTSNIVGVDLSKYKLVYKNQFACDFMSVIRVHKLPVVLHSEEEPVIVSPAYTVFEVTDENVLLPEYLMMWFRRPEFDRYADFRCDSAIRGGFKWDELCEVTLPIPSIEKQQQIVAEYNTVTHRIELNEQINQNLEATAQALYKHWFVDFEFPIDLCQSELVEDPNCHLEHVTSSTSPRAQSRGERREVSLETLNKIDFTKGYKSSGGKMVYNEELDKEIPVGWKVVNLGELIDGNPENISKEDNFEDIIYLETSSITKNKIESVKILNLSEDDIPSRAKRKVKNNDIIYSTVRPALLHYGLIRNPERNLIVSTGFAVLRLKNVDFIEIIYQFLISVEITKILQQKAEMSVSTYPSITLDDILQLQIALPSQHELGGFKAMNKNIGLNNIQSQKLKDLQSLLLAKMTQGVAKAVEV